MGMLPIGLKSRTRSDSPSTIEKPLVKMVLRTVTFEKPEDPESLEFMIRSSRDQDHVWIIDTDSRVHLEDWIISLRAYVWGEKLDFFFSLCV